jgi:hypothetical protein
LNPGCLTEQGPSKPIALARFDYSSCNLSIHLLILLYNITNLLSVELNHISKYPTKWRAESIDHADSGQNMLHQVLKKWVPNGIKNLT